MFRLQEVRSSTRAGLESGTLLPTHQAAFPKRQACTPKLCQSTSFIQAAGVLLRPLCEQGGRHRISTSDSPAKEPTAQARRSLGKKAESLGKAPFGQRQEGLMNLSKNKVI